MSDSERSRSTSGKFIRTPEQVAEDARTAELYGELKSFEAVAQALGVSRSTAWYRVHRAFRDTLTSPAEAARAVERERLAYLQERAMEVMDARHITVSHGKIITIKDSDGNEVPLTDHGPVLAAIDRALRLSESARKLDGLDQPTQVEHTGGIRYEVVGIAPEDLV